MNDAWADLGELIDTRTQMLEASKELHKYFHDCKDVLGRILEKENSMSEELGRDSGSVSALLRKHQNFLQDLQGKWDFFEKISSNCGRSNFWKWYFVTKIVQNYCEKKLFQ